MRLRLFGALFTMLLSAPPLTAQVMDQTMVPRGRIRLQAHPTFESWDTRFGRLPDGSKTKEQLGDDLTDPTSLTLFPGMPSLQNIVRDVTGDGAYLPVLGRTDGRITQDITQVDWGLEIGLFDWLTLGAVLPWVRPRTVLDVHFVPDTENGNLGLNPTITAPASVTTFLGSTMSADASASANAATICSGGLTPECATAQALAQRMREFNTAMTGAYGATPFFPFASSPSGLALQQAATTLSADLIAAGLLGLHPMALGADVLSTEGFPLLPAVAGSGINAAALETRSGIYAVGDVEVSARVRLLDNLTPRWTEPIESGEAVRRVEPDLGPESEASTRTDRFIEPPEDAVRAAVGRIGYRLVGSFMARLPTGAPDHVDVLLDHGTGQGQLDLEGGLFATLLFGRRIGLSVGGRYAVQGSTSLTKRVAPPELAMPPASTRAEVMWTPGTYLTIEAAPTLHLSGALTISGEYRFFHKGRDQYQLINPDADLDDAVLEVESGITMHQIGGGLRYDTVTPWMLGEAPRPMEIHLRLLTTIEGSGGHVPESTRIEAGIRLFKRFWGPRN